MTRSVLTLTALFALAAASLAQTNAEGFITYTQNNSLFTYDITLHNTGTTNIGTLWYAWVPGQDYLPVPPSSTSSPSGWTFTQTTSLGFGTGLRWTAPGALEIAPGDTMSGFEFTTTTTPAELAGLSIFGAHPPVGTSFVYEHAFSGLNSSGGFTSIVINPVPEPATFGALGLGAFCLVRRRRRG
ncbi:MAG: PEP-CTERM sorting domain-containing protein [Armatimonadetes bacterium]|nr:PEP-CTERM sorting domain-containing protein [Armatimonadota bacterium]